MVANERAKFLTGSIHGFDDRSHVPDKALEFAAYCSHAGRDLCKIVTGDPADATQWHNNAWSSCDLCCNPGLQLDAMDEASVW